MACACCLLAVEVLLQLQGVMRVSNVFLALAISGLTDLLMNRHIDNLNKLGLAPCPLEIVEAGSDPMHIRYTV